MLKFVMKAVRTGTVTQDLPPAVPERFRGRPDVDASACDGCGECVSACPPRVISVERDASGPRLLRLDLAGCTFCGDCVPACPQRAVRMTQEYELASRDRETLMMEVHLQPGASAAPASAPPPATWPPIQRLGNVLRDKIGQLFGRSLHIREVSAGDCNACDLEVQAMDNAIFDASRFGIQFVASPRHADMLLVTGPVSRNMAGPLVEAFNAMPEPKLVVAAGACACAGGVFARSPQTLGGVDALLPVNTYIPGCPPRPQALLHGILMTLERAEPRFAKVVKTRA